MSQTWAQFMTTVEEHLSVDATRRGLEDFRERTMRNAVVDLQRHITAYQQGHTTTYVEADLDTKEYAQVGNLPTGAIPSAFYIYSLETDDDGDQHTNCWRNRLDFWPWIDRHALICTPCDKRLYAYAISPQGKQFLIHPALNDDTKLLLVWQGLKINFADGDTVPWPEEAAEAVAAYVKWRILLEIDKNPPLAQAQYAIFKNARGDLYLDERSRLSAEKPDEEYDVSIAPVPGPISGSGVDPYVTSETLLAAVATTELTVPIVKVWVNAATGLSEIWRLLAGSDAAVAGAIVRPDDYDATDPKTWYKAG